MWWLKSMKTSSKWIVAHALIPTRDEEDACVCTLAGPWGSFMDRG